MKTELPKKLARTMQDIRKPIKREPVFQARLITGPEKVEIGTRNTGSPAKRGMTKNANWGKYLKRSSIVIAGSASLYIVLIFFLAQSALGEINRIKIGIPAIRASAEEMDTKEIASGLVDIYDSVRNISDKFKYSGMGFISRSVGIIFPPIGEIPGIISSAISLNEKMFLVAGDLDILKSNGAEMMISGRGAELISTLERMKENISNITVINSRIAEQSKNLSAESNQLALMAKIFSKNYIQVNGELLRAKDFLGSFINLLKQPEDRHILLMFQNPTEMRPAGGFIGSFGDLVLNQGNLKEIKIDDIYNADRQLNLKILPPKELRGITPTWGARDANWFFDFPTSGRKVISFLEDSNLFKLKNIQFDGAIAINTNVLQSILKTTGPIVLEKYNLTITPENFLEELQREVEAGQDKKPGQNPKRILSVLSPMLMEKLDSLSDNQKSELTSSLKNHLDKKDIMIYFKDWPMQNFFESLSIAGKVIQLPEDYSGDYLAVVNANIAGGKTDAVTSQHIAVQSAINTDGKVINQLTITRSHTGGNGKDWWYNVPNKNYLKLLVPENSVLLSIKGNDRDLHVTKEPAAKNLKYDPDLASIEKTATILDAFKAVIGREFGKFSFGSWVTTQPGESKTVTVQYQNGVELKIRNNMKYEFIFEKQSGAEGSLEYSITAPTGYIWKETGRPIFEYGTQQIKAREIIMLTLLKN